MAARGNSKHSYCFYTNSLPICEGDLKEIIEEDLRERFKSFQDQSFPKLSERERPLR